MAHGKSALKNAHAHKKKGCHSTRTRKLFFFFDSPSPRHTNIIWYFLLLFLTHSTMSALSFYRRQYWISYYGANDCFGRTHLYEPICIRREVREINGVRLNLLEALCLLQNSTTGARPRVGCKGRVKVNAINGERFKTVNARLCERCKRDNNNNNNNNNKNN